MIEEPAPRWLDGHRLPIAWVAIGALLLGLASLLLATRHRFDWARELIDIPALPLMAGLVVAGIVFLAVLPLVRASETADAALQRHLLGLVIAVGLILRLMMFATEPALEDDQQRYLWEGALVANGLSPYRISPADAKAADRRSALGRLADAAGPVLERVNHPALRTIYPPGAQAWFAAATLIQPFSLNAWRLVLLAADIATLGLLLRLLGITGRSGLWVALYWWNPLVIKEVFNSGHMEGVLTLLVVLALFASIAGRPFAAAGLLGLAVGVKIWPLLLTPLVLRPFADRPRTILACLALLGLMCVAWAAPIISAGLDASSGFVAYAERWQANGALLPGLRTLIGHTLSAFGLSVEPAGRIARALLALIAAAVGIGACLRPIASPLDQLQRAALVTLVLTLTTPAQFPWYMIWTIAFLPFAPRWGVMAMAVTVPIYYASFYFNAIDAYPVFRDRIVWLIWIPIWAILALEVIGSARCHRTAKAVAGSP